MNLTCPICNSENLYKFLERFQVPVHQNLLMNSEKEAIEITRGDLKLFVCNDCEFIFNSDFDFSKLNYGKKYDNTQDISPFFNSYISELAENLIQKRGVQNSTIVEIGCGKGIFLKKLVLKKNWGNVGFGFDPSYIGGKSQLNGRLNFEKKYYDLDCSKIKADVIICRHVIEHIQEPLSLLKLIKSSLGTSKSVKIYFETPTVDWILKNEIIYDFFYEHCSYFNLNSLRVAFELSGFKVSEAKTVFEGQYMWFESIPTNKKLKIKMNPSKTPELAKKFLENEKKIVHEWREKIKKLAKNEKIAIWGAGAKGVTFCNLIDPNCEFFKFVIDLNPKKHGKFIAGTGHKIINFKEIPTLKITKAVLMNSNYYKENLDLLKKLNINIELLDT
jgi:SAM-dependent methyltransferase